MIKIYIIGEVEFFIFIELGSKNRGLLYDDGRGFFIFVDLFIKKKKSMGLKLELR